MALVLQMGGPLWSAPIHDRDFIAGCLKYLETSKHTFATINHMKGMLSLCHEVCPQHLLNYAINFYFLLTRKSVIAISSTNLLKFYL